VEKIHDTRSFGSDATVLDDYALTTMTSLSVHLTTTTDSDTPAEGSGHLFINGHKHTTGGRESTSGTPSWTI